jgi:hypothetical protein
VSAVFAVAGIVAFVSAVGVALWERQNRMDERNREIIHGIFTAVETGVLESDFKGDALLQVLNIIDTTDMHELTRSHLLAFCYRLVLKGLPYTRERTNRTSFFAAKKELRNLGVIGLVMEDSAAEEDDSEDNLVGLLIFGDTPLDPSGAN